MSQGGRGRFQWGRSSVAQYATAWKEKQIEKKEGEKEETERRDVCG